MIARPTANPTLYKPDNTIKTIRIKLPKTVLNNDTNRPGTANIITHKKINKVINPTARLILLREVSNQEFAIILYYNYNI
jgi:hypothetical protein